MKKFFLIFLALTATANAMRTVKCDEKEFRVVDISDKAINRIVFPDKIVEVVYSKEKPYRHSIEGRNLFLKTIAKNPKSAEYYVILADGRTCQFIFSPKRMPAQVVYVEDTMKKDVERIRKALSFERADTYEKTMKKLILAGINENPPPGYVVEDKNVVVENLVEYKRNLVKEIKGTLYTIKVFVLHAKDRVRVDEKNFIDNGQVRAVSVLKHELMPGEETRVIVVEGNVD